ncbi:MOSC domain containing protein [Parvibaculum lavamentivorans DS-1]|uniref:MOSC domain containing protein n=2 Tax=Parvibaculum lavamentivorans TaxID=256618 RepID=A7HP51_PARL1|nr:MOSC domain containing protein [Parvibaculum lavamentivorans DS-1]
MAACPASPHPLSVERGKTSGADMTGTVVAVSLSDRHAFSKAQLRVIHLLAGLGVEGDAHCGKNVQHLSRVARDPSQPNLRQVHLIHAELHDELAKRGFEVPPGSMGENITTRGIDILAFPTGTRLSFGKAVIEITGLRNPCVQLDRFQPGLLAAVLGRGADGALIRKAGVMGIVVAGGPVKPGDAIEMELPVAPHIPLATV